MLRKGFIYLAINALLLTVLRTPIYTESCAKSTILIEQDTGTIIFEKNRKLRNDNERLRGRLYDMK